MSVISDIIASLTASTDRADISSTQMYNVANGPATGPGSTVDSDSGPIPTILAFLLANQATIDAQVNLASNLANTADPAKGDALLGVKSPLANSIARTQHARNQDYVTGADFGVVPDGSDITTKLIDAYNAAGTLEITTPGVYKLTAAIPLASDKNIILRPGVELRQYTANTPIFTGVGVTRVNIMMAGATLRGEGSWSGAWTGSGGHDDRAIFLRNCTEIVVGFPRIINCALAGIAIFGGRDICVVRPRIEGTHTYSTPLPSSANFQFGIYIKHAPADGPAQGIQILEPNISGTAIGFLSELEVGGTQPVDGLTVTSPFIHDIPGQHAFYLTNSNIDITGPICTDIFLSAIKIQAGDANQDIANVNVTGLVAKNLGSQMFEVATPSPFTGTIRGLKLEGVGENVGRAASFARRVRNVQAELVVENCTGLGVQFDGADLHDIDVKFNGYNIGLDGIAVTATASDGLKIKATIRNPNTTNTAGACGIRIDSASASVELEDPDITDANIRMQYGLFNATVGSTVRVRGRARFRGASDTAVRATGAILEWPTETDLVGTNGAYTGINNISGTQPLLNSTLTATAANTVLWQRTMADNTAIMVKIELTGMLIGTTQRRCVVATGLFYRSGGIATLQGAVDVDVDIASGAFTGAYTLTVNGANDVVLNVNSGGVANYVWQARVTTLTVV